jgi:uncharacterized membrane protein YeaQ/YmgE (transglycosylase-associated protein family)
MLLNIVLWIIVGAIAGILADWAVKGIQLGLLGKICVGIVGGVVGGYLWSLFTGAPLGFFGKIIAAFIGAVIFLLILRAVRGKK